MATAAWFWMPLVVFQGFHAVDLFFAQRISSSSLREACRGTSAVDYDTFHAVAATLLAANTACVAFQFLYITRAKVRAHTRASRLAGRTGAFFDGIVEAKLARLDFIAGSLALLSSSSRTCQSSLLHSLSRLLFSLADRAIQTQLDQLIFKRN